MKTVIVGMGLIGGSIALDLAATKKHKIVGIERSEEFRRLAAERKLADSILGPESIEQQIRDADLVILAIPVDAITALLPRVLDAVGSQTAVTDMGSTKGSLCKSVESHPKRAQFVPSHPMAGTENSGPLAAVPSLFQGRTAVICDSAISEPSALKKVEDLYDVLGMRRVYMGSDEHDLHAAFVSHLSHISSFVLANTVLDKEQNVHTIFDLAGGGFESTVRLAKSSPEMWGPIFRQNREYVIRALSAYIDHLQRFNRSLIEADFDETGKLMKSANEIRRVLLNLQKGKA